MSHRAKFGLVLLAAVLYHRSQTPPSGPKVTSEEQRKAVNATEIPLGERLVAYSPAAGNAVYWLMSLTEVTTILARFHPDHPLSQRVFRLLKISPLSEQPTISSLLGAILVIAGSLIRLKCYREMGRQFTFQLALREGHKLVTTGPYSIVRHPSYTGGLMSVLGFAVLFMGKGSWWREGGFRSPYGKVLAAFVAAAISWKVKVFTRAGKEDRILRQEFRGEWEDWARKVPYRYVPGIY